MLAQSQLNHIKTKYQHSNLARSGFFIFEENITNIREAFQKKNETWKIPYLRGGPGASFSICYNETFKMHKNHFKPF